MKKVNNSLSISVNGSPRCHSMSLRSICQDNCCLGSRMEFKNTRNRNSQNLSTAVQQKTVRKSRTRIPVKEATSNEMQISNVDVLKTSTPKEIQVSHIKEIRESKLSSNAKSESVAASKTLQTVKKSDKFVRKTSKRYSDYSSGYNDSDSEEMAKTDYTYAKSLSYRSRVTPNRGVIHPNMSRRSIRSDESNLAILSDTSSDEDNYKKIVKAKNEKNQLSQFFQYGSDVLSQKMNKNVNIEEEKNSSEYYKTNASHKNFMSTPMKYSYGLDNEYSDNEEFEENETSHKVIERTSIFMSIITIITKITMLESIFKVTRWLWFHMWKAIYLSICYIMLLDTWIIYKFSRLRRWKHLFFLLLLLMLPLLLLGYFNSEEGISNSIHSIITSLSSSFVNLSSSWSQNSSGKEYEGIIARIYNMINLKSIGSSLYNWSLPLWVMFSFRKDSSAEIYKQETNIPVTHHQVISSATTHLTADQIKALIQEVFKQEITGLTLQQQNFILTENKKEIQQNNEMLEKLQFELKHILHHSKDVAVDVSEMKNKINFQENRNEETNGRLNIIENKLDDVEKRIHIVEDILMAMRNCCHNQSDYLITAEKHIASLLLEIMNNNDQIKSSPFAMFGNWLKSRFVGKDELENYADTVADRVSADLSSTLKQRAEVVAKAAASAIVAESVTSRQNLIYENQENNFLSNDTRCASEEKVKSIVKEAILLYDADKTGLVDYALESSGGSIFSTRCSETYHTGTAQITVFGIPVWYSSNSPRIVIQPEVHPGQCWAFKGTQGYLVIKLSVPVRPTAFSMEHIPKKLSLTGSIDSAPKDFSVLGLKSETDVEGKLLGTFMYNKDGDPLQYFYVKDAEPDIYPIIELRILSNHGHMDYTCLYRFRVHGRQH